jgi:hypothetical protein
MNALPHCLCASQGINGWKGAWILRLATLAADASHKKAAHEERLFLQCL